MSGFGVLQPKADRWKGGRDPTRKVARLKDGPLGG